MRRLLAVALLALAAAGSAHAAAGISYRLGIEPREALYGDPVTARVDVIVDPSEVPPSAVRIHTDFRPYTVRGATVEHARTGRLERLVYVWHLDCLRRACLPGGPEKSVQFRPVRITWNAGTQNEFWPALRLASRIDPRDILKPSLRSEVIRQPAVTYAVAPSTLVAVLLVAAALLLAYPALLLVRLARRVWWRLRTTRLERMTPMERALELLRAAAAMPEKEPRRRALERVARELGEHELSAESRRLAWSRPRPESDEMDSLRTRVEGGP